MKGAGRCVERACAYPSRPGGGYCLHHARMFGGRWPLHAPTERNVEAVAEARDEPEREAQRAVAREMAKFAARQRKRRRRAAAAMPTTVRGALEAHLL